MSTANTEREAKRSGMLPKTASEGGGGTRGTRVKVTMEFMGRTSVVVVFAVLDYDEPVGQSRDATHHGR